MSSSSQSDVEAGTSGDSSPDAGETRTSQQSVSSSVPASEMKNRTSVSSPASKTVTSPSVFSPDISPSHGAGSADKLLVRRNSKDQLDNIKGFGDGSGQRRSSSSSSIRSRHCSGESQRRIETLPSIKETINSEKSSQEELEQLIQAKLSQCRVVFDFVEEPLSDLTFKVCIYCIETDLTYFFVYRK